MKSKAPDTWHPPRRQLLLPVSHVFLQGCFSVFLGTRTHRSFLSRTNSSCSAYFPAPLFPPPCTSLESTGPPHSLWQLQDIPVYRCTMICRTSPHWWTFRSFRPFDISDNASLRLSFYTCMSLPGGYIFCGGIVGLSLNNGSKDWPSR